jgi:Arylsulfotransferase (ASST)
VVTELDANGAVVWTWDLMDHIPIEQANPQWRSTQSACPTGMCYDPYHWNSIEPVVEPNGDPGYVMSFRHLDAVYNVNRATNEIVWRLGGEPRRSTSAVGVTNGGASITASDAAFTNADLGARVRDSRGFVAPGTTITGVTSPTTATISQPTTGAATDDVFTINPESLAIRGDAVFQSGSHFGGQHDARSLGDGTYTLFDNGSGLGRAPRAVRYRIDTTAGTATLVEQFRDTEIVPNSICCGSARKLPDGNWVIGWGGRTTFTEMTARGTRIFNVSASTGPIVYRALPVPYGKLDRATLRAAMDANTSLANDVAAASAPPSDIVP